MREKTGEVSRKVKVGFGVDLGGTTVKMACFDAVGSLLDKWEIPTVTRDGGSQILPDIAASIEAYMQKKQLPREQIIGIGIGVPGPVTADGTVNRCINLGWDTFNVCKALSERTGLPVKAGNDASVAALGECWKGSGAGCANMVFVTLGTGVGGGIVADGKVLLGTHGAGGEIGHMVLNRSETEQCGCGKRGCVEQYCSATGILRLTRKALAASDMPSSLRRKELTCKDVFDAAKAEDPLARQVLEQVYAYMGEFLANICNITDPELVVLGGGVSKAGQFLLEGIRPYFEKYVFYGASDVGLALASLGNDAGVYGAFRLVQMEFGG